MRLEIAVKGIGTGRLFGSPFQTWPPQAERSSTNWLWFAPSTFHDAAQRLVRAASKKVWKFWSAGAQAGTITPLQAQALLAREALRQSSMTAFNDLWLIIAVTVAMLLLIMPYVPDRSPGGGTH